jgi:hypothetical protein
LAAHAGNPALAMLWRRAIMEKGQLRKEACVSVQSRIQDAEAYWQNNQKEKALLAVLSAANDTARRRYPQAQDGKEALSHFLTDATVELGEGATDFFDWDFRGGVSLGEVLSDIYRSLLESGRLPPDVELTPGSPFRVHVLAGLRRAYSDCLVLRLVDIVRRAPENVHEFSPRPR